MWLFTRLCKNDLFFRDDILGYKLYGYDVFTLRVLTATLQDVIFTNIAQCLDDENPDDDVDDDVVEYNNDDGNEE